MTFSWHLLSICWFWSLSFVAFYSRDFTFCSWLFVKAYFYLRYFYLSSWMASLRDSLSFKCYAVFSLNSLHSLSSFLATFLQSANYDSMARIFSLDFSKSIDCKFYKSAIFCSLCCISTLRASMIVLYFSSKSVKASLFVLLLISPKEPFKDCLTLTCELELLLDSVTKDEFYRIFDETYRFWCFCCFYFYLSFSFWATSLCNCWLIFYIYCFMRLFSLLSFRFYFSS